MERCMSDVAILFLTADPSDASRLRLGQEFREIHEKLQLAKMRERFSLEARMSVRPGDVTQAIFDIEPQIVHFSGHGTSTGKLCLENESGNVQTVQPDALVSLFELVANRVRCVILNTCYSAIQAGAIAKHIDYVIGMKKEIGDEAAIAFSVGFYKALGAGRSLEEAYKFGVVELKLLNIPEYLKPVLLRKTPTSRVQLVLKGERSNFDERTQDILVEILATILNVDAQSIRILHVASGSIRVIIELPSDSAQELITLFNTGSAKLERFISQFHVQEINREESEPTALDSRIEDLGEKEKISVIIQQCITLLLNGREADSAAKRLGDIAIEHESKQAVRALWESICGTHNLPAIIDPCAYTIGRIVWEPLEPSFEIEDVCFEIFKKSRRTGSELIIDKFAFTVGEVVLRAKTARVRQRAREFVITSTLSTVPLVREKYTYTKKRIS
jgi:hypothetical protein